MSEAPATNSTGGGASPQPINPLAGARGQHRMNAESFLDGFDSIAQELEAQSEPEAPRSRPRMERPDKARAERKATESETPAEETPDDELPAAQEPEEEDPQQEPSSDPEEEEASLLPEGKGTRENPLTLKDLPKDKFVELKVDGQKVVVDLAEGLEGAYMRPAYFHQLVNGVKGELGKARQIAERAVKSQEAAGQHFASIVGNPQALLGFLLDSEQGEEVAYQMAVGFSKIRKAETENPEYRLRRIRARDERDLSRRQQELDSREHTERTTRENQTRQAQLQASWKPGMDAGMKAAGFPVMTPELSEEIELRLSRVRRRKGTITAEDWEAVIPEAAKAVGAKPAAAPARKPAPAPRQAARPEVSRKPANGKANWDEVPHNVKVRNPDFFWR